MKSAASLILTFSLPILHHYQIHQNAPLYQGTHFRKAYASAVNFSYPEKKIYCIIRGFRILLAYCTQLTTTSETLTKIHIFSTFATINYFPRGTIVKVYREYAFLLTPFSKKTSVQKQVQNLNCHNCPNVSKVAERIQQ